MSDENENQVEVEIEVPEIEIIDDTPEQDRGRTPLKEEPAEVTDEELSKYSDQKLKDRLAHLGKGFHDARRQKEAAIRERDEAVRLAQQVAEENKKLQGSLSSNQSALLEQAKKVVAAELEAAKAAYKKAHEEFDADALLEAQEKLIAAKTKAERVNNFKPAPVQQPKPVVQTQPQPQVDDKTQEWVSRNKWFETDKKMRTYALALHEDLVESGVPVASDEYFKRIDEDVRKRFPETFAGTNAEATTSQRRSNVAPAGRSTAPKKIVLTQTQVALAKRLGVSLEAYASSVAELKRKQV